MDGKKSEGRGVFVVLVLLMAFVVFCGCFTSPTNPVVPVQPMRPVQSPPNFDILTYNQRTGYEGFDYVVYIDAVIYNKGGPGRGTVWCKVSQDSNFWTKSQTIYLNKYEQSELAFVFREVSFWGGGGEIRVWVTY